MIIVAIISAILFFIAGFYFGVKKGKKYINQNVVLDAVIDAAAAEIKDKEEKEKIKNDFYIEHYPLTNRYYPRYKGFYLKRDYHTGIIEKMDPYLFAYSNNFSTERDARNFIELAKEHMIKVNVTKITI
jgi:hypothetical protein